MINFDRFSQILPLITSEPIVSIPVPKLPDETESTTSSFEPTVSCALDTTGSASSSPIVLAPYLRDKAESASSEPKVSCLIDTTESATSEAIDSCLPDKAESTVTWTSSFITKDHMEIQRIYRELFPESVTSKPNSTAKSKVALTWKNSKYHEELLIPMEFRQIYREWFPPESTKSDVAWTRKYTKYHKEFRITQIYREWRHLRTFEELKKQIDAFKIDWSVFTGLDPWKVPALKLFFLKPLKVEDLTSLTIEDLEKILIVEDLKKILTVEDLKLFFSNSNTKTKSYKKIIEVLLPSEIVSKFRSLILSKFRSLMYVHEKNIFKELDPETMLWVKILIYIYQFYQHHEPHQGAIQVEMHPQIHMSNILNLLGNNNPQFNTAFIVSLFKLFFKTYRNSQDALSRVIRTELILESGLETFMGEEKNITSLHIYKGMKASILKLLDPEIIDPETLQMLLDEGLELKDRENNEEILSSLVKQYEKSKQPLLAQSILRKGKILQDNGARPSIKLTNHITKLNKHNRNEKTAPLIDLFSLYFEAKPACAHLTNLIKNKLNEYKQRQSFDVIEGTVQQIALQQSAQDLSSLYKFMQTSFTKFMQIHIINQSNLQNHVRAIYNAKTVADTLQASELILKASKISPDLKKLIQDLSEMGLNKTDLFHLITFNSLISPLIQEKNRKILKSLFLRPNSATAFSPKILKGYQALSDLLCPVTVNEFEPRIKEITLKHVVSENLRLFLDMKEVLSESKAADFFYFVNALRNQESKEDFIKLVNNENSKEVFIKLVKNTDIKSKKDYKKLLNEFKQVANNTQIDKTSKEELIKLINNTKKSKSKKGFIILAELADKLDLKIDPVINIEANDRIALTKMIENSFQEGIPRLKEAIIEELSIRFQKGCNGSIWTGIKGDYLTELKESKRT